MTDHDLLAQFVQTRSQDAFAQLVRRHIDWLHAAALRLVRDSALAQDVTQAVFLVLVQKAPTLAPSTPLAPWLFRVLQYVASNALRAERRRKNHESEAAAMRASTRSPQAAPDWSDLAPLLEPAVRKLPASDRAAILLRFYQRLSLPDVGAALGITEEAARKRVSRAVDRLRNLVTCKRGARTAVSAAVLTTLLLKHTVHAAPAGLSSAAAGLSTGVASAGILTLAKGALSMLLRTQIQLIAVCTVGVITAGGLGVAVAQSLPNRSPTNVVAAATTTAPFSEGPPRWLPLPPATSPDARRAVADITGLKTALNVFEVDMGRYPTTGEGLAALLAAPSTVEKTLWRGPYLKDLPNDPWGRTYIYRFPGTGDPTSFYLLSAGPDGKEGTPDDITKNTPAPPAAQTVPFDQYEGYFVVNTFEPDSPRSFVVCADQAAFDKVFNMAVVMGDRSHRLPAGIFEKSLVVAPINRGAFTSYSQISTTLQDGVLTLRYTARQDAPGTATFTTPLILSVPKADVKTVVFVENGAKVGEKPLKP